MAASQPIPDEVPVYSKSDAVEMADVLADRYCGGLRPGRGFTREEMSQIVDDVARLGRSRSMSELSGLDGNEFVLDVYRLATLLTTQERRRLAGNAGPADGERTALRNAFVIMLASSPSSPIRDALRQEQVLNVARRPAGLDRLSHGRQRRHLEELAPQVRAARTDLFAACEEFLAAS